MAQIKRIGVKQTAKVAAVFYFVATFVFIVPVFLITLLVGYFGGTESSLPFGGAIFGGVFIILLPVFYALMGGLMVAISTALYNLIAKKVGGIEIELDSQGTETTSKLEPNKKTLPKPTSPVSQSRPPMPL